MYLRRKERNNVLFYWEMASMDEYYTKAGITSDSLTRKIGEVHLTNGVIPTRNFAERQGSNNAIARLLKINGNTLERHFERLTG